MRYAIVENSIVTNMIELKPSNAKDFPNAVYADEWSIQIGDTYNAEENSFYRGEEIILSEREKIVQLESALALLTGEYVNYAVLAEE